MLIEALEKRAREHPEAPWLFYRRGLDWHWRSYLRVADQVARSARLLAEREGAAGAVACRPRQDPDALAALLAALASRSAIDLEAPAATPGGAEEAVPWLVACRGSLERFTPQALEPFLRPGGPPRGAATGRFMLGLARDVEHLSSLLAPPLRGLGERPILYAGVGDDTGDDSPSGLAALAGWALETNAAWALEPYADAFAATALWTRPHVLVATAAELGSLSPHFDRAARRRSRLRAVVLGGGGASGAEREEWAGRLDCPVLPWHDG